MAGKLEFIVDGGTSAINKFSLPTSATKSRKYAVPQVYGEYVQLVITDGGTGDTNNWGLRNAAAFGIPEDLDVDIG
jgi:hypothetical protein